MREPLTDDELDRLLRTSNPYPPTLDTGLSLRAEADLERILRVGRARRRRAWAWRISVPAMAAAAVALVVALVVNPIGAPEPAAAQGLAPLTFEPNGLSTDQAVDLAQSLLDTSPGVAAPIREAVTVAWYAHITMGGSDDSTVISPEVVTWTWDAAAKTSRIVVTAGEPYEADGTLVRTRDDISPPGTVLRDDQMGALTGSGMDGVEHPLPVTLEGSSVEFYQEVMRKSAVAEPTGFDVLSVIPQILNLWTLTNEQHANLLEQLRGRDDVELLGTTRDRADREVLAFAATSEPGLHTQILLVSAETGRVIAAETIYLGDVPEFPLPTGSVMSYELWEAASPHR